MKQIVVDILSNNYNCSKEIIDAFILTNKIINSDKYNHILCSVSGGADSDILVDICTKLDVNHKVTYIFFDTGIECNATHRQLEYLEERYGIKIIRHKADLVVPLGVKKYGYPFLTKDISGKIELLQKYNFTFEDKPYDELIKEYPNCSSALKWWCNEKGRNFNIDSFPYLKEYMIKNPPQFKISNKCCDGAKKNSSKNYMKEHNYDLSIIGVRKSEGGVRKCAYGDKLIDNGTQSRKSQYRPIYLFTDEIRKEYEELFNIVHSDLYKEYGFIRSGCIGCPYNSNYAKDSFILKQYEPKIVEATNNIFKPTHEYTLAYRNYYFMESKNKSKTKH